MFSPSYRRPLSVNKPLFSICLIARNESKTLPRLINSLKEFQERGGEILLLDTGSTDTTIQVAESYGLKVHAVGDKFITYFDKKLADKINNIFVINNEIPIVKEGDKNFDFAAARNYIAQFASNDMIASPDCDEIYTVFDIDKINDAIAHGFEQLEYNFVYSHNADGSPNIKFAHCKFYNKTKMQWVGVIHEVLQGNAKKIFLPEDVIYLEHYQNGETNRSHYLTGLSLDCYLHPNNDRNCHYMARELYYQGRPWSSIKLFQRHISMGAWLQERAQSYNFIGDCCGMLGKETEQIESYQKAFNLDPSRRESLIRLAEFYYRKGDAQRTAAYALAATTIPWNAFYANFATHYTNLPHEMLYWAYWVLGNKEESKKHYDLAFSFQPTNQKYLHDRQFYYPAPKQYVVDQNDTLLMICPTRNRPDKVTEMANSFYKTIKANSSLLICIDEDDEVMKAYHPDSRTGVMVGKRGSIVDWLNRAALAHPDYKYYGIIGDDGVFITEGWDLELMNEIKSNGGWGISFAEDLICSGKRMLPTHPVISGNIVKTLGFIIPPEFVHLYGDDYLGAIGKGIGKFFYRGDVIIEHRHWSVGKASKDEGYTRIDSKAGWDRDTVIWNEYQKENLQRDIDKVKEAMRGN